MQLHMHLCVCALCTQDEKLGPGGRKSSSSKYMRDEYCAEDEVRVLMCVCCMSLAAPRVAAAIHEG
eukprot:scaffold117284_cov21-Tisochrysis_lutea.AAC.1